MGAFCADRVADHSHMFRFYKRRVAFFPEMDFNRHAIVSLDHIQDLTLLFIYTPLHRAGREGSRMVKWMALSEKDTATNVI